MSLLPRRVLLLLPLLLVSFGLAGACGESGNDGGKSDEDSNGPAAADSGPTDGEKNEPKALCKSDKDCSEVNGLCDFVRSVCVDCIEDQDCGADSLCQGSVCSSITLCDSSKDCSIDEVCHDVLGFCVECELATDCADDMICHETACALSCSSDKDCQEDSQVCNDALGICRNCVAHSDCAGDEYCSPNGVCLDDVCSQGDSACSAASVSLCTKIGDGFLSTICGDGCDEEGVSCKAGSDCSEGEQGCPCYGNGTCNNSLSCLSNSCVDAGGGTGGGSSSSCTAGETENCSLHLPALPAGTVTCESGSWNMSGCTFCQPDQEVSCSVALPTQPIGTVFCNSMGSAYTQAPASACNETQGCREGIAAEDCMNGGTCTGQAECSDQQCAAGTSCTFDGCNRGHDCSNLSCNDATCQFLCGVEGSCEYECFAGSTCSNTADYQTIVNATCANGASCDVKCGGFDKGCILDCASGSNCNLDATEYQSNPSGKANCASGTCTYDFTGGDTATIEVRCEAGATCDISVSGFNTKVDNIICDLGATCNLTCSGDSSLSCTCTGAGCNCSGDGCPP